MLDTFDTHSAINHPSVCLHQDSGAKVLVSMPPVTRTRCCATSTQNTLIQTILRIESHLGYVIYE